MSRRRKILIYCDTPFQIMMAVHLRLTVFAEEDMDIIVADHMKDHDKLAGNIEKTQIFGQVFPFQAFHIDCRKGRFHYGRLNELDMVLHRKKLSEEVLGQRSYDLFLTADILLSSNIIYDYLIHRRGSRTKVCFYEEGPVSVICDQHGWLNGGKRMCWKKILGYQEIKGNFAGGYTSVKEQVPWNSYFPFYDIPRMDLENSYYLKILNQIWEFGSAELCPQKYIFFEESFFQDGIPCTDMDIVRDMCKAVGEENIYVKLHPRTRENRFAQMRIAASQDSSVPWELVVLNNRKAVQDKLLIAVTTGAIIHPQLYWGINQNAVVLGDCREYLFEHLNNRYYQAFLSVCRERNLAYVPTDRGSFLRILKGAE